MCSPAKDDQRWRAISDTPSESAAASATRYQYLIEHIQDAVVEFELVEGEPIVRHVNSAFVDAFGYDPADLTGESLNEWIVPAWALEEAKGLDEQIANSKVSYQRVRRETASGLREFLYRGVPCADDDIEIDGFAVYTDLTEASRQESRLQVMNRILRHNLRNNAHVILGHTTQLLAELDGQTAERTETAAALERAANDLRRLTEEASDINTVLSSENGGTAVDCRQLVEQVAAEHRAAYPSATIDVDAPESVLVGANSKLAFAIESLVENGIEHNPSASPHVRIRIVDSDVDGWVDIYVEDNGSPIPPDQRAVITGDADITSTQHGLGLGLWIVKWTTELFGGELAFETSDLGGNSVRIRLPRGE